MSQWLTRELARRGELPVVRLGDRVLVRPEDLRDFVDARVMRGGRGSDAA